MTSSKRFSEIRHSFKNHLSVIIAFAQLLQKDVPNQTVEQRNELLKKIDKRAKQMVEEIDANLADE